MEILQERELIALVRIQITYLQNILDIGFKLCEFRLIIAYHVLYELLLIG